MAAGLGNHWGFPCCTLGRPSARPGYLQLAFTVWAFTAMANVASLMLDPLIKVLALIETGTRVTCKIITARSLTTVATGSRQDPTRANRTTNKCSGHD